MPFPNRFLLGAVLACTCAAAGAVPFRIATQQGLAFGSFAAGTGGSVTVSPGGARSRSGGVALLSADAGHAAIFNVTGNNNTTYTITLPAQAVLTEATGHTMTISSFTSSPSDSTASSGLLIGGSQLLYVGGTLSVGASQATGSYSGSFSVIVNNP
jgi:hypothetical protein